MRKLSLVGPARAGDTLIELLLECHQRIRDHLELARRLCEVEAPDADVAASASRLVRYFDKALPLHAADEDESIAPRLAQAGLEQELATMADEHERMDAVLAELVPLWRGLERTPGEVSLVRARAGTLVVELKSMFDPHLTMEETRIFPAVSRLPDVDQNAIVAELRARRAPPKLS